MNPYVLIMAVLSLTIGLGLYIWLVRSNASYFYSTNVISWLLIALFPVLLIFSFFPESSFTGTIKGVSLGGAIGAFIFIWWYGTRITNQAAQVDDRIERVRTDLSGQLEAREKVLQQLKDLDVKRVVDNDLDKGIKMGGQYRDPPQNLELLSSDWARWGKGWVKSGWFYNPPDPDLSHAVAFFKIHLWDRGDGYVHILSASNTEQTIWLKTDAGFKKEGKFRWDYPDLRTDFWDKIKWK